MIKLSGYKKEYAKTKLLIEKIFKKYGNYNQKITEAEDYEIIDKILKTEKAFYLPLPLYRYYIHEKNISHSGKRHEIIKKLKKISKNV